MSGTYQPIRRAMAPMTLVGAVVGAAASDDPVWILYGLGLGWSLWLGWAIVQIAVNAAVRTRREREGTHGDGGMTDE